MLAWFLQRYARVVPVDTGESVWYTWAVGLVTGAWSLEYTTGRLKSKALFLESYGTGLAWDTGGRVWHGSCISKAKAKFGV